MAESQRRNSPRKAKERRRRDARMLGVVQAGSLPYTPPVMSWLSVQLDRPASRITKEDVDRLIQSRTAAR